MLHGYKPSVLATAGKRSQVQGKPRLLVKMSQKNPKIILIIIMLSCLSCNSSPRLRALARGLSPAYLRFGGTKTDFLIFDPA